MMDVVGNNIANINTSGFKASQTVFEDTLSQELRAAGTPQAGVGGTNPAQVGLGVRLGAIATNFGQGASQLTGRATDLAIQGDGFFSVRSGGEQLYTRAGAFSFDQNGTMVTPDGSVVQGWLASAGGVINTNASPGDLKIPLGASLPPVQTSTTTLAGNLDAGAVSGTGVTASITMYDAQGVPDNVKFQLTSAGGGTWNLQPVDGNGTNLTAAPIALAFNGSGQLTTASPVSVTVNGQPVSVDISGLTQYGGQTTAAALSQDGSPQGSLSSFTISQDGTLVGVFSNGLKQALGQVAIAGFTNPPGLEKVGGSLYRSTVNSGNAQIGVATTGGRGSLASGTLEMSNVDLGQEFTQMIVAQRGFEANAKVITASDEILQDLVNLKH
jgi:flagellar hook protein FlgE